MSFDPVVRPYAEFGILVAQGEKVGGAASKPPFTTLGVTVQVGHCDLVAETVVVWTTVEA